MITEAETTNGVTKVRHLHCATCATATVLRWDCGQLHIRWDDSGVETFVDPESVELA